MEIYGLSKNVSKDEVRRMRLKLFELVWPSCYSGLKLYIYLSLLVFRVAAAFLAEAERSEAVR